MSEQTDDVAVFHAQRDPLIQYGPGPDYRPEIRFYEATSQLFVVYIPSHVPTIVDDAWLEKAREDLVELEKQATIHLRSLGDRRRAVLRL